MKPLNFDFSAVTEIDWARLAAYIDGEGCIRIAGVKGKTPDSRKVLYLEVTIANTDVRLVEWLRLTFAGSHYCMNNRTHNPAGRPWAPAYAWVVGSRHAAGILEHCLPYFIIKREQAEIALAFQRTIAVDKRFGCKGRPVSLLNTQYALRDQLSALKGTSARQKRHKVDMTVQ